MTIRYGNDLFLTEYARQVTKEVANMNQHLNEGHLQLVFLSAEAMIVRLFKLQERLNDLKYKRDVVR